MVELLGWSCTALVLIGFYLNSNKKLLWAGICWVLGDIGWIIYDIIINNPSHAVLSAIIIIFNIKLIRDNFKRRKSPKNTKPIMSDSKLTPTKISDPGSWFV